MSMSPGKPGTSWPWRSALRAYRATGFESRGEGLRVFEKVPGHLAWILEQDRGVSILGEDRGLLSNLVIPVCAEKEGTNVVRRTRVALEIATSSLHAPMLYEGCRIHPRKRVLSWPPPLGHNWVNSSEVAANDPVGS